MKYLDYSGKKPILRTSKKIKYKCDSCGKDNEERQSHYKKSKTHFCNMACYTKAKIGMIFSKEARKNMSVARKKEWASGQRKPTGFGKKRSLETRKKISRGNMGNKSHFWKDGVSQINRTERQNIMSTFEYRQWRKQVFGRDNYVCQICEERGGKLRANHIKLFSAYKELRLVLTNGITICKRCDIKFVLHREPEWESYFNFNLATRGFIEDEFIPSQKELVKDNPKIFKNGK